MRGGAVGYLDRMAELMRRIHALAVPVPARVMSPATVDRLLLTAAAPQRRSAPAGTAAVRNWRALAALPTRRSGGVPQRLAHPRI